mgnify:CR=1 FL=1|jgi:hypothetical protein
MKFIQIKDSCDQIRYVNISSIVEILTQYYNDNALNDANGTKILYNLGDDWFKIHTDEKTDHFINRLKSVKLDPDNEVDNRFEILDL